MAFKSEAQRRKFGELVSQGKMSKETFDEWNNATTGALPDRVGPSKDKAGAPSGLAKLVRMGRRARVIK